MKPTLKVIHSTTFKKNTLVDSRHLGESQKHHLLAGGVYPILAVKYLGQQHYKVTFAEMIGSYNTWNVFAPHVQFEGVDVGDQAHQPSEGPLTLSQKGLDLIKYFEGLRTKPYYCSAGVLTVGYGSTGDHVVEGKRITVEEAERLLKRDLVRFERAVNKAVSAPLTQGQYDSAVSFAFNIGVGGFLGSKFLRHLNEGDMARAAYELRRKGPSATRVQMERDHFNGKDVQVLR